MCMLFCLVVGTVADRLSLRQRAGSGRWPEALHLMKNMVEAQVEENVTENDTKNVTLGFIVIICAPWKQWRDMFIYAVQCVSKIQS